MWPERQSGPAGNRAAKNVATNDSHIVAFTGCPCGCLNGVGCVTERPAPTYQCGCQPLTLDRARWAAEHGLYCDQGCVLERLAVVA